MGVVLFPGPGLGPLGAAGTAGGQAAAPINVFLRPFVAWPNERVHWVQTTADIYRQQSVPVPPTAAKDSYRTGPFYWSESGTNPRLVLANARINPVSFDEDGAAPAITYHHAALEYPAGTLYEARFGGGVSCTLNAGDSWESAELGSFGFTRGDPFWVRLFPDSAGADLPANLTAFGGAGIGQSGDGLDHVLDAADPAAVFNLLNPVINTPQVYLHSMLAVTGTVGGTARPVAVILSDSIAAGSSGGFAGRGFLQNALQTLQGVNVVNLGAPGDSLQGFNGRPVLRPRVAVNGAGVFAAYLTNDFRNHRTAVQMEADVTTLLAQLAAAGKPVWWCTICPSTTSTDSWTTTLNQGEIYAGSGAVRTALNNFLKAAPANLTGAIDSGDAVASVTGGALWHVNTTTTSKDWTINDGVHPGDADGGGANPYLPAPGGNGADQMSVKVNTTNPAYLGPVVPVPQFTAGALYGAAPLSVAFTDGTLYAPTSWLWQKSSDHGATWVNFAGTPAAQNPTESFADVNGGAGTLWSVRLTAANAKGGATFTKLDWVGAGFYFAPAVPNLVLWARADLDAYQTRDGPAWAAAAKTGDVVGQWNDQSGLGHHLLTTSHARVDGTRPTLQTAALNGHPALNFPATDPNGLLQALFTLPQPVTAYVVLKPLAAVASAAFFDGGNNLGFLLDCQSSSSPITPRLYGGANVFGGAPTRLTVGTWYTVQATLNGASSSLSANGGAKTTGDGGANAPGGFTLANRAGGTFAANMQVAEVVLVAGQPTGGDETNLLAYLRTRYNHY